MPKYAKSMAFRVNISDEAQIDTLDILQWLTSEWAGKTGLRWFEELEEAIYSLAEMPSRCGFAPENEEAGFEVRQLLYGRRRHSYRILFTISGETVTVLHVYHGHRSPAQI